MIEQVLKTEKEVVDDLAMEAILFQQMKFVLKEAHHFKLREKGTIVLKLKDFGKKFSGGTYTCGD